MDRASLERILSRGLSLQAIARRLGRHESTVAYWVEKHGLQAANRNRHLARGALRKEDLERLVQSGASIAEIAEAVDRSKATVRHWLTRFGLKTSKRPGRRPTREARAAKAAGLASMTAKCPRHGETEFCLDGRGGYRCKRCRSAAVTRRRRKMKAILVQEAGGACRICGYRSNMRALHFHHVDPADKRLELNAKGISLSLETLRAEAQKCVLLCSNCHAEVEDGTASIPASALGGHLPAQHVGDPG
jgi:transposase